jgi:hypothetical protein
MYSLSDAVYHVAKSFSHVTGGKIIEDFHLPEVGKPPISPVIRSEAATDLLKLARTIVCMFVCEGFFSQDDDCRILALKFSS